MYILPHFLAYSKYYFCPGPQLQDLGASKQTKKYFIGGIGGRYLRISFGWSIRIYLLRILYLTTKGASKPLFYMPYKWRAFRKYRNIESVGSAIPRIMIIFIHASCNGDNLIMRVVDRCSAFENEVKPDCFQESLTGLEYSLNLGRKSPGLSLPFHCLL